MKVAVAFLAIAFLVASFPFDHNIGQNAVTVRRRKLLSYGVTSATRSVDKVHYTSTGTTTTMSSESTVESQGVESMLNHKKTAPNAGYISTVTCIALYCASNSSYVISIPEDHNVLVSFKFFLLKWKWYYVGKGYASLYTLDSSGAPTLVWKHKTQAPIPAQVFKSSLLVRLVAPSGTALQSGFEMFYTIHRKARSPQQLPNGLFDCSVTFYSTFKDHFQCNLKTECANGEDEGIQCPYTNAACKGKLAVGDKCYFHIHKNNTLSWRFSRRECQKEGGDLASIKSEQEWKAIFQLFETKHIYEQVYIGLHSFEPSMPNIYRDSYIWVDGVVNYRYPVRVLHMHTFFERVCFFFNNLRKLKIFYKIVCDASYLTDFLCEIPIRNKTSMRNGFSTHAKSLDNTNLLGSLSASFGVSTNKTQRSTPALNRTLTGDETLRLQKTGQLLTLCPAGHVTHAFLSCDPISRCGQDEHVSECPAAGGDTVFRTFRCDNGPTTLPFSLVCNFRQDCDDGSDESFCVHTAPCRGFRCLNKQCIHYDKLCDTALDCWDGSDEACTHYINMYGPEERMAPPALVDFTPEQTLVLTSMQKSEPCPGTHYRCPEGYCLPLYTRCNGIKDCVNMEDEAGCDTFQCPGFYRCRGSSICVSVDRLCDGWSLCPQQDDEWLCHTHCPEQCTCHGQAFACPTPFPTLSFPGLRYLDAADSGMELKDITGLAYLVWLSLTRCSLKHVTGMEFPNLRYLDLSHNDISSLDMDVFLSLHNLQKLDVSWNPIQFMICTTSVEKLMNLEIVRFPGIAIRTFNSSVLSNFPRMRELNISHSAIRSISEEGFRDTPSLSHIDLRGSKIQDYPSDVFKTLTKLQLVQADNYKLCCKELLPVDFNTKDCVAPVDEVSSCEDLLRSNTFRTFLWLFSVLSIIGNLGCIITRLFVLRSKSTTSFSLFVTNLSIADLLMGVYLAMVGAADTVYRGQYFWFEKTWKPSIPCQIAGVLSLVSGETSAVIICLITLDRFLVLSSPFSDVRFKRRSTLVACIVAWSFGMVVAMVPLLPINSDWDFYSQTGICVPLPITRSNFKGRNYAFGIIIIFNLVLFLLIATGQAMIYWTIRTTSMATSSTRKVKDLTIARRLVSVVVSDFLCWFPIGLLGIMASCGTPIPGEVNVGMAIFVLPLNAALNPFLYTFNALMEKWEKLEEQRLLKQLQARSLEEHDR